MKGKIAIVTGGGAGIGKRISEVLATRGAAVAVLDVDKDSAVATAEGITAASGEAIAIRADVAQDSEVHDAVQSVLHTWGRIDVLVNNAGIVRVGSVTETSEKDWDLVLAVNLKGVYLCSRHVLPLMVEAGGGTIVNIASAAAIGSAPGLAAYSASKAGVANLTRGMAKEYGPSGVRVNCVLPGTIPTAIHRAFYSEEEAEETLAEWAKNKPLQRNGTTDDIAATVAFLASDEARFITGALLPVDGGATI